MHRCRQRPDELATGDLHANLLAVTQIMLQAPYDNPQFLVTFGGQSIMIESPLIQELLAQSQQQSILQFLEARCGEVPADVKTLLEAVQNEQSLRRVVRFAALCPDLDAFGARLFTPMN